MATINYKDILNTKVTVINKQNGYDKVGEVLELSYPLLYLPEKVLKDKLIAAQQMEYQSEEQKQLKGNTPRYYISGIFELEEWKQGGKFPIYGKPITGSNLMTIDIDGKDNTHLDLFEIRKKIFNLPYVFSCLKSFSGKGYYCIIPIEDTMKTKEYYKYIVKLWKQQFDINCDENSSSLIRARVCSYDEDMVQWIKKGDVQIWNLEYIEKPEEQPIEVEVQYPKYTNNKQDGLDWNFITHKAIELLIADGYHVESYNQWYYLGCALKNFPDGEQLFIQASQNPKYTDSISNIIKRYNRCTADGLPENTIVKYCGMARNRYGDKWFVKYLPTNQTKIDF